MQKLFGRNDLQFLKNATMISSLLTRFFVFNNLILVNSYQGNLLLKKTYLAIVKTVVKLYSRFVLCHTDALF
jgi:hypothetical protein